MNRTEGSFRFKPFTVHDVVYLVLELVGKRVCVLACYSKLYYLCITHVASQVVYGR